jgi:5-methylcytosine-specific restriction endonuclease McrA
MQPHQAVTWQEAVVLSYLGKAEVLEHYDAHVSSPSMTIRLPAVLRLKKPVSRHKKDVKFSRANLYARDDHRCQYCGEKKSPRVLTYDHVLPFSRGGKTEWTNIVTACGTCNRRKANRTPEEAGMHLIKRPIKPKALPLVTLFAMPRAIPSVWEPYLGATSAAAIG